MEGGPEHGGLRFSLDPAHSTQLGKPRLREGLVRTFTHVVPSAMGCSVGGVKSLVRAQVLARLLCETSGSGSLHWSNIYQNQQCGHSTVQRWKWHTSGPKKLTAKQQAVNQMLVHGECVPHEDCFRNCGGSWFGKLRIKSPSPLFLTAKC